MSYESFAYYYDSLMDLEFYEDYYAFINKLVDFNTVLELGCGTGEIAIRLAKDNKAIYATDFSKDMLEVARNKAMYEDVNLLLARVDMSDFSIDGTVDLVLCLCDSLNYLLTKDKVISTFKNAYNSLNDTGAFIFDVNSIYKIDHILADYHEEENDDEFYFCWDVKKVDEGLIEHYIKIVDKTTNDQMSETHLQQTYSLDTYLNLLKEVGFKKIEIFSDFKEYQENCERVIFVCYKEN